MQDKLRTCAFCGHILTSKTKSREHVWAQWLQKRLDIEKLPFEGIHSGFPWGSSTISTRVQSTNSIVLGGVCASCNNGWMSGLEVKVSPIFESLWEVGKERYIDLDSQSCEILAQWAFKTSLTVNLASNYRRIVPPKHFTDFYKSRELPENSAIDIALAPFDNHLQWNQSQSAIGTISGEIEVTKALSKLISTLYVITLDIAGVLLRTMWVPTDFLEIPRANEHNVRRIHPFRDKVKLLSQKRTSEMGTFHISARFRSKKVFGDNKNT
jgi:hypothetical protein